MPAPVAMNDSASTTRNTPVTIAVLANDIDADGDALTVTTVTAAPHGTAVVNANGTVLFTPAADYEGDDQLRATRSTTTRVALPAATVSVTIAGAATSRPSSTPESDQAIAFPTTIASLAGTATDDGCRERC